MLNKDNPCDRASTLDNTWKRVSPVVKKNSNYWKDKYLLTTTNSDPVKWH